MSKDITLTSSEWTDIVFEGRNKEYGAYEMRQSSSKRHTLSLLIMTVLVAFISVLPTIIDAVKPAESEKGLNGPVILANIKMDDRKENVPLKVQEPEPPVKVKPTIQFVPPVIADPKDIKAEQEMKSQDELLNIKATISSQTREGSLDADAVDAETLKDNTAVVGGHEERPIDFVEQMPQFPGGDKELMVFVAKNLRYPVVAAENRIEGRVVVKFVVSKTGDVTDIHILRGLDPSCDKEAVRVIKMMPRWIPGKQNGRNVPVYFTLPVVYKLE